MRETRPYTAAIDDAVRAVDRMNDTIQEHLLARAAELVPEAGEVRLVIEEDADYALFYVDAIAHADGVWWRASGGLDDAIGEPALEELDAIAADLWRECSLAGVTTLTLTVPNEETT